MDATSYALSRGFTIDTERHRLQALRDRAKAALSACRTDENRDCVRAQVDVFSGLLTVLDRAAATPNHTDTRGSAPQESVR